MPSFKKQWRNPGFILDVVQAIIATAVAIVLALDMTGIWSVISWLPDNLNYLIFISICVLIVSSVLERRFQLEGFAEEVNQKLDKLAQSSQSGVRLENRQGLTTLEARLVQAEDVSLLGINLVGLLSNYEGFIKKKAKSGCKFRIIITDPGFYTESGASNSWQKGLRRKQDAEHAIRTLLPVIETTENIHLRFIDLLPSFSLLIIDPNSSHGKVQVELYLCEGAASDRPHFILTQSNDKYWYDFFRNQFDLLWENARDFDKD